MSEDVNYVFVDTAEALLEVCNIIDNLTENDFIGLDTEFMRVTCYYPDFSLMQLAIHGQNYIIDVWMLEGHVKPIILALCNTKAVVLAFACNEDIELLAHEARRINSDIILPKRIYDLQLLMAFCGHSYGRGLSFALKEFLDVNISKDCTRSNWTLRPLSEEQLIYSALDVHYLESLYNKLKEVVSDVNFSYFLSEMDYIKSRYEEEIDEDSAYLSVSAAGMLTNKELNILQYIAKKRLEYAQIENKALNRIITSKSMWQLARYTPRSKKELEHRGVKYPTIRQYGDLILKWIQEARYAPMSSNLAVPYDYYSHQRDMQGNFEILKQIISERVAKSGICPQILLKKALFNDYFRARALGYTPLLQQSWRLELLGEIDVPLEPINIEDNEDSATNIEDSSLRLLDLEKSSLLNTRGSIGLKSISDDK